MTTNRPAAVAAGPVETFFQAVELAGQVVAAMSADQLALPTPCTEFDVRQLLRHLVVVVRRVAGVGRGHDPFGISADDIDGRWVDAWNEAVLDARGVWADPDLLTRPMRLPWTTMAGSAVMAIYTCEVTVHTWDLATATGQEPSWDDEVVAAALAASQHALPADWRGDDVPFGPVVPTHADATPIDRLVAWNGRDPGISGSCRSAQ